MGLVDYIKILKKKNKELKKDGIEVVAIFGSFAKDEADEFSDVDLAYKIEKDIFFKKYIDGFSQILKLQEIKEDLEKNFKRKVDFVPYNKIKEDKLIYVR